MTEDKLVERHDWRCDCEECWIGLTYTAPPPRRSIWQRARATLTAKERG